ncbi:hypothetical protein Tco_1320706 [Tanacetum coccineum]
MAPMALSVVKTCSKTCLKNHETLKTQYDKLRIEFNKSESDLDNYKRGLASVEEQLVFYKKNEGMLCDQIIVPKSDASFNEAEIIALKSYIEKLKKEKENNLLKINNYDNATKSLDKVIRSQLVDNHKKGLGITRPNPKGNMIPQDILMRFGRKTDNAAKPKAAYNAVKRNRFNAVKSQQHVVLDSKEQSG